MQECWRRRYASFLRLKLDELPGIHPTHRDHELLARRDLVVGSLLCGTDLATCTRSSASLFFHSPNVVQTLPVLPYVSPSSFMRGHYSWNKRELLTNRLEELIFPTVLLSDISLRLSVFAFCLPSAQHSHTLPWERAELR